MKNLTKLLILFTTLLFCGCEIIQTPHTPNNTVLFFYPWSSNLTHYFEENIRSFKSALNEKDLQKNNIFVFISNTDSSACMYKITSKKGIYIHDTIAKFENYNYEYTTIDGLSAILSKTQDETPTKTFSLVIGCHGDAWIPSQDMKRSFGGATVESRIDISTLCKALQNSNLKAEYILFDDCYMSSIEVAYELRNACKYLIASPAEIMAAGMPYTMIAGDLLNTPNYAAISKDFYDYYVNHPSTPYGSIAITKCDELDALASIVKQINQSELNTQYNTSLLQVYDGYNPNIFYDFGDYINTICANDELRQKFNQQLDRCIPHKHHTSFVYAYSKGTIKIDKYSGISTSAPSTNTKCASYKETSWYKATNN